MDGESIVTDESGDPVQWVLTGFKGSNPDVLLIAARSETYNLGSLDNFLTMDLVRGGTYQAQGVEFGHKVTREFDGLYELQAMLWSNCGMLGDQQPFTVN